MIKVGINGFGRIGRNIYRAAGGMTTDFEIVAVNDIGDAATFAHLLKHDTPLGTFGPPVSARTQALKVSFGSGRGMMTTIHAYASDQRLQDLPHKDLRRARAAADNVIPTSTGANRAVAEVLPELTGKFAGMAFRVPVLDVSVVDLTVELNKTTSAKDINTAFDDAAKGELKGILAVSHEELVSSDFKGDPHSSIVDAPLTLMLGSQWAKVVSWYDNEWGFSCRMVDLINYMAARL